jgi:hypothetical protein
VVHTIKTLSLVRLENTEHFYAIRYRSARRIADKAPSAVFDEILSESKRFSGNTGFEDDVCLVGIDISDMPDV